MIYLLGGLALHVDIDTRVLTGANLDDRELGEEVRDTLLHLMDLRLDVVAEVSTLGIRRRGRRRFSLLAICLLLFV